jgi:hypothetical protein
MQKDEFFNKMLMEEDQKQRENKQRGKIKKNDSDKPLKDLTHAVPCQAYKYPSFFILREFMHRTYPYYLEAILLFILDYFSAI